MPADSKFTIAPDHPALAGHSPGNPIVPGVLVLEHVQVELAARIGLVRLTERLQVKFLAPLRPGETCAVAFPEVAAGRARFERRCGARIIGRGLLQFTAATSGPA